MLALKVVKWGPWLRRSLRHVRLFQSESMSLLQTERVEPAHPAGLQPSLPAHSLCHACWPIPGACPATGRGSREPELGGIGWLPETSQYPPRPPPSPERSPRKVPGPRPCPHSLYHFFSGNFQVKMSLLSPRLSVSLLCSFSPAHWSVEIHVGDLPTHPGADDEDGSRDHGDRRNHSCPSWGRQVRQAEERVGGESGAAAGR